MERVHLEQVRKYDLGEVRCAVERSIQALGGCDVFFTRGEKVLLKPNLLAAKSPERGVTTHPFLVQVVAEMARDCGCIVLIGDSPGMGTFATVAKVSGIAQAARNAGVKLTSFDSTVEVECGGTFRRITVARAYLEADRIINLPKLKTHEMMTLTCGVKNLFGAVVGPAKPGWHLAVGKSRELFARLLIEIYLMKKPTLTIVDGIIAMEGNGPSGGDAVELGAVVAGVNPVAVDVVCARLARLPEELLYVEREAGRMGLAGARPEEIALSGVSPENFGNHRFKLPKGMDVQFGLPGFIKRQLRPHLTARPEANTARCTLCGACRDTCPPAAITIERNMLSINHQSCILCWCCRELCPHDAMEVRRGTALRIADLIGRLRKSE